MKGQRPLRPPDSVMQFIIRNGTRKCRSSTAEHFCTPCRPHAPTAAPRADRRQRHKAIEQRRRDKAKDLLLQLQSLLVPCPLRSVSTKP